MFSALVPDRSIPGRQTAVQHPIQINSYLTAVEYARHVMPYPRVHRRASDRRGVLVVTLIQVQPDFAGVGNRKLIAPASACLTITLLADDVLVVATDRVDFDLGFDRDWTANAEARTFGTLT